MHVKANAGMSPRPERHNQPGSEFKRDRMFKGSLIDYVRVSLEGGVRKISTYSYLGGGSNPFLRNVFQVYILYLKSRGQLVFQGSYFIYLII